MVNINEQCDAHNKMMCLIGFILNCVELEDLMTLE